MGLRKIRKCDKTTYSLSSSQPDKELRRLTCLFSFLSPNPLRQTHLQFVLLFFHISSYSSQFTLFIHFSVRGMMYYRQALDLQGFLDMAEDRGQLSYPAPFNVLYFLMLVADFLFHCLHSTMQLSQVAIEQLHQIRIIMIRWLLLSVQKLLQI